MSAPGDAASHAHRRRPVLLDLLIVAALLAGSAAFRVGPLGPSSLWLDDTWVALVARVDSLADVGRMGLTSPGFAVIMKGWLEVFGTSSLAAQALPFLAGVAAPPLAYAVGRRMMLDRLPAAAAGVVLLASTVHMTLASRVKQYTLEAALALVLVWLGLRILDRPADPARWLALVVVGFASVMTSGLMIVPVIAALLAGLAACLLGRRPLRPALASIAAFALLAGAWWAAILRTARNDALREYWAPAYVRTDDGVLGFLTSSGALLADLAWSLSVLPAPLVLMFLAVAAAMVGRRRPALLVLLAGPTIGAYVLAALALAPLGGGRTDAYLLPSLALLLAAGFHTLIRGLGGRAPTAIAVAAGLGLASLVVARPAPYPQEDLRSLVPVLEHDRRPGDGVLVYGVTGFAFAYYTEAPFRIRPSEQFGAGYEPVFLERDVVLLPHARDEPARYREPIAQAARRYERIWLVESHRREDLRVIERYLSRFGFELLTETRAPDARISMWEKT